MPPAPASTPIPTFSSPRTAPRPKVIPLFATTISRRTRRQLAIHQNLHSRPHHYPHARRVTPMDRAQSPRQTTRVNPNHKKKKPPPIIIAAGGSLAAIESPLTSVEDNPELPTTSERPPREVNVQLIAPPHSSTTVTNAGWSAKEQQLYRQIGRDAITRFLEIGHCLSNQQPVLQHQAREYIESRIPAFTNHEGHWGADTILRDQLKSMKDTRNKRRARQTAEPDAE
ncbi:hypothetical protein K435DRAFT_809042 [Dendrothele bispora CBS 962.96]|uniref:Uncharacterized protein n=1 Tax=Dendrothele bispora (strain CBS 962.96) TaxID=1314807 RepID=A0A4S8KZF8_DENBC|nr:hypothetical protein K435DRAFT_809042 [Dendrothele bispora CBS 962.96]